MATSLSPWLELFVTITLAILISLYIYYRLVTARYWSKRNVPHVKPTFLLGTLWKANITIHFQDLLSDIHLEHKSKKMIGIWSFHIPNVIITDIKLIKRILVNDFSNLRDRFMAFDVESDPLLGHLFVLTGKKWRNLRVNLTPAFSSGKMKMMFPLMMKCGDELRNFLEKPSLTKEAVEVKDIFTRYTTDVIGSCAFGLDTNAIRDPKSEFRKFGQRMTTFKLRDMIVVFFVFFLPKIAKFLKLRMIPKDVSNFFLKVVQDTIEYRERTQTVRNDFLQLLIQLMRAGKIEDVDKTSIDNLQDEEIVQKFSLHEAAAQCFVFFTAGFETSSSALTFAFYELALNPDVQSRLQSEIDAAIADGDVTYEKLTNMEYLDMVVQETLRKYPPVGNLQRCCINKYEIPEMGITLDTGTIVGISILGIHRDPEIYPEPERFNPERFSVAKRETRDACSFLPFGDGPRSCIGNRFALMQVKVGIISVLRYYNVEVTKTTPIPVKFSMNAMVLSPKGGMNLVFTKR